jgi:FAD/FMN-containing dehydrogenase/SAM-dependent methyltransferase
MIFNKKLSARSVLLSGLLAYLVTTFFLIGKDIYYEMNIQASSIEEPDPTFAKYMHFEEEKRSVPRESIVTAKLAVCNDKLLKSGYKYGTRLPAAAIGSRLMAVTLFPASLAIDSFYSTGMVLYCKAIGNETDASWYRMRVTKDLLGLVSTPASLLGADLVTNHFIPVEKTYGVVCPYGKLYSACAIELYPKTAEDVQKIICKAKELNKKVTIAGKLFSQGKQALPLDHKGIILHMDHLNTVTIDETQKVAICGAGATWEDVQKAANEKALAVKVMQASNVFSVGGSLSINCHGWDHKAGSIDQTVYAINLVNSEGELLHLTPKDELFHLALGGLGGFGVIVEAELSLTDNTLLSCQGESIVPASYLDYFREKVINDPTILLHYYRLSLEPGKLFREGIAVNYVEAGNPEIANLEGEPDKGNKLDRIELQTLRRVKSLMKWAWKEEKRAALHPVIATRNEVMQPPIRAILSESDLDTEWLQEYFVKPEYLEPFLTKLGAILNQHKVALFNASVRYIEKNNSKSFNYAPDGERFAIVLFFNQSLKPQDVAKAKGWMNEAIDALHEFNGSYYLPYQAIPSAEQFRKSYPDWEQVRALKEKFDPKGLFDSGFFAQYLDAQKPHQPKPSSYRLLFSQENGMREEVAAFLETIFMQVKGDKLLTLMDEILAAKVSDEKIYPILLSKIDQAKDGMLSTLFARFRSLFSLQNELAEQAKLLIGDEPLNHYVEIGYPGRMIKPLKKSLNLTGKMIVVNTEQNLSDYMQTGIPSPVDQFVPLNDYEPLNSEEIPSGSVDLVSLFIGLHHVPEEKLEPFIRSIERVLRPGGKMIFMDHDAHCPRMELFLSLVHSLFNAGTGVSAKEENEEYRNFQPLQYWIDLAGNNGLVWDGQTPLVRKGDPTLNSLIILKKPESEIVRFSKDKEVVRPSIQTYLTGPEWQNVRSAQNYAAFIEHTPFYQFPYFQEIGHFWHVYKESWKAARRHHSLFETLTAEYTFMNTFIGIMMTVEYGMKGLISLPLSWIFTQEGVKESLTTHILIKEPETDFPTTSRITHLVIPRYKKGTPILIDLATKGADFLSISGQQMIQIDLLLEENDPLPELVGARFLYQSPLVQVPARKLASYEMPVSLLAENLRYLTTEGLIVDFIHDF